MRVRRLLPAAVLVISASAPAHVGAAETKTTVKITSIGPQKFRARVAAGQVIPCDSMANTKLFEGLLLPGQSVSFTSPDKVVCVQQTSGDWPDVGWTNGFLAYGLCYGFGGRRDGPWCLPGDGTIDVTLRSGPPKK
jgi:hypothetical protein